MAFIESIKVMESDFGVHMLSDNQERTSSPPTSPEESNKEMNFKEEVVMKEETNITNLVDEKQKNIHSLHDGDRKVPAIPLDKDIPVILDEKDKIPVLSGENVRLNPEKMADEQPTVFGAKAYYYSQSSVMLFEKAVEENPEFPEELDRVHSWFMKELSDAQKLVCLRGLLSLISPSQNQFLFTSVSFDSLEFRENETVWLDLAMSETQELLNSPVSNLGALEKVTKGKLETRLKTLDLTPGESLFYGMNVAARSKLPSSPTQSSSNLARSNSVLSSTSATSSILSVTSSQSTSIEISTVETVAASGISVNPTTTESVVSSTDACTSKFSSFINFSENGTNDDFSIRPISGKAPPGFLSPTASEFRPSEPSCHSDVYLSDFTQWLRLLRLHKYTDILLPHHNKDKLKFLEYSETELEQAGVCAMGARRKFMRLFERIKEEKNL